jgi:hypothetical protein
MTKTETAIIEPGDLRLSPIDDRFLGYDDPCFICGRETAGSKSRRWVHTFAAAVIAVTAPTDAEMSSASYSGLHPVGAKCAHECRKAGVLVLTTKQAGIS